MTKKSQIINGTSGDDVLFGDVNGTLTGKGANQTINGLGGNDILYGDSFFMDHNAHGGNDTLSAINSGLGSHPFSMAMRTP